MIRVSYEFDSQKYVLSITTGATTNTAELDEDEATQLVKDLMRQGVVVRTERESVLDGKLEATERHLEDMRRLTFLTNEKDEV